MSDIIIVKRCDVVARSLFFVEAAKNYRAEDIDKFKLMMLQWDIDRQSQALNSFLIRYAQSLDLAQRKLYQKSIINCIHEILSYPRIFLII